MLPHRCPALRRAALSQGLENASWREAFDAIAAAVKKVKGNEMKAGPRS